jgi:hypothetical protein
VRGALIILFVLASTLAFSQGNLLEAAWKTSTSVVGLEDGENLLSSTLERAGRKKNLTERQFLNRLFDITQKRILSNYSQYSSIDQIVNGQYDCLTATTWFAALLTKAGYQFDVIETNYHIFLMVHLAEQDVLLETTDRFNGFVVDRKQIEKRLGIYQQNMAASTSVDKESYLYQFQLFREVAPEKLPGLLYFNQAVKAYNNKNLKLCAEKLQMARNVYETPRIAELADILLQSVVMSGELTTAEKHLIQKQFEQYRGKLGMPVASR